MSEASCPAPTWRKTRKPASYMAWIVWRNQTGSIMCRTKIRLTRSGSVGNGAASVADQTGTLVGCTSRRRSAAPIDASPDAKTGVWNAERNGSF